MGAIRFVIAGPLRVLAEQGVDLTPRSAKAQGLLLLLVRSPHGVRGRRWVQDKLWSDRGAEQGANSLRQELSQIRRALGRHVDILLADRQNVWLDLSTIEIDQRHQGELAEGLDVRDPEFEYWLAVERVQFEEERVRDSVAERSPPSDNAAVLQQSEFLRLKIDISDGDPWLSRAIASGVSRLIDDQYLAHLTVSEDRRDVVGDVDLRLSLFATKLQNQSFGVMAEISDGTSGRWRWSERRNVEGAYSDLADHPSVAQLGVEIVEAVRETLMRDERGDAKAISANMLCAMGIRHLFSIDPDEVRTADIYFARANMLHPRGLFLAWRAQLRAIQRVELHNRDLQSLRTEAESFVESALEMEPTNSMVLALCANACHILLLQRLRGYELAKTATQLNPSNPMAWWAYSSAGLYANRANKSYEAALRGRYLAARSPFRFWWDLQLFIAAMMSGRTREAIAGMESCAALRPGFLPPLRYLTAVHASVADDSQAHQALMRLRARETDFDVSRMLTDPDYPASLVHTSPIIDVKRVAAILQ